LNRSIDKLIKGIRRTTDKFRALGIVGSIGASVVLEWFGAGIEIGVDVDTDTADLTPLADKLAASKPQLQAPTQEQQPKSPGRALPTLIAPPAEEEQPRIAPADRPRSPSRPQSQPPEEPPRQLNAGVSPERPSRPLPRAVSPSRHPPETYQVIRPARGNTITTVPATIVTQSTSTDRAADGAPVKKTVTTTTTTTVSTRY